MKAYKRLKGLGKGLKFGLAGAVLYAATLALPIHATNQQVVEPVKLEQITTVEQAENMYKENLKGYCIDKKLDSGEIKQLHGILEKEKELLDGQNSVMEKYLSIKKDLSALPEKRVQLEERLNKMRDPNVFLNYLSEKKKQIEDLWGDEYPGIINREDKAFNIVYPADMELTNSDLKNLVGETVKQLNSELIKLNDSALAGLSGSDKFNLKDVASLLKIIGDYEAKMGNAKNVIATKEALKKQIKDLKLHEKNALQEVMILQEKEKIEYYIKAGSDLDKRLRLFSDYLLFEGKVEEFIEKFGDRNKYWSFSIIGEGILEKKEGYGESKNFLNSNKGPVEDALNQYLESAGLEAKVKDLKNPSDLKFHPAWCLFVNALLAPIVRNLLVKKYVGAKYDDEYIETFFAGFGSFALGITFTDGLHPLAYWIRMGTPLVIQPLKKILGYLGE